MPDSAALDRFITRWRANEGGAERANYVLFLAELCDLLDLPRPEPADATRDRNDYVFERAVTFHDEAGRAGHGRIDLYRRGCFVLEAKQSREPGGDKEVALSAEQASLPGLAPPPRGRRSAARGWDVLMRHAREQAEQYARALPSSHGWPPFILVCDVGHAVEVFADFSGQGKNYRQFPDRTGYRIFLDDLRDPAVQDRLRAIWTDPLSLDPARRSAAVTRDIAGRLAQVSRLLEARGRDQGEVAYFLMRCLFTMFAQSPNVGLLDRDDFTDLLDATRANPDSFAPLLEELWRGMDTGTVSAALRKKVRLFNGGLFKHARALPLNSEEIGELLQASRYDWADVEPAIFGTLLEQALDPRERRRLGAHYTPRAYVERLVAATIVEPLQREWETVLLGTIERERADNLPVAVRAAHDFHVKLARTRVLDPACGTGNFLYVALELMKRLEGEVLEVLADLGGQEALALETETVHPKNFLGLELNPRAAAITELVLWLGYIQWQLRNRQAITDPVLEELKTIRAGDAVLIHDGERFAADGSSLGYANPRRPDWPEADYIVGNPPFIGKGAALRQALGDAYCEALWRAHPRINKSADFVMYWWDRAAETLVRPGTRLKRFGLVTTNSITQLFSRKVTSRRLEGRPPVHLLQAYPDHPWTKATPDAAAVRIAMTVVEAGEGIGTLHSVVSEAALDSDEPQLRFRVERGRINTDLTVGPDVTGARPLRANLGLCYNGTMLASRGFLVTEADAAYMRADPLHDHAPVLRRYIGGAELARSGAAKVVIDTYGLDADALRTRYPRAYQHLLTVVKPDREHRRDRGFRERWWEFGRPRPELRAALDGLPRFIGTTETSRYRTFQFIERDALPDHMVVAFALDDDYHLGVLHSRPHRLWAEQAGGWLGIGNDPRYSKSRVFDTFPFPAASTEAEQAVRLAARELDMARHAIATEHPDVALSTLYRLLAAVRVGSPLDLDEQDLRRRWRVDVLSELHARLDAAVMAAYAWPAEMEDTAILKRLVALNAERHAEERGGRVRWLRRDYQLERAEVEPIGTAALDEEQLEADLLQPTSRKPAFPRDAVGQTAAVLADLRGGAALSAADIADRYAQGRRAEPRIASTLAALTRLGHLAVDDGRYRLRRAA